MKAKPGRVVRVTVTSKLPEFKDKMIVGKLVDKGATWDAFLKNNWITLNDEEYCISALRGRVIATTKDKVSKVIDEYRMSVPDYKVKIVRKIANDSLHEGPHDSGINQRTRARLSKNRLTERFSAEEVEVVDVDDTIDTEADVVDNDDFVFAVPQARPRPRSHSVVRNWNDRLTSSSRDTFAGDVDKSVKEFAIEKLRACATNGYIHRIREELRSLQANRKGIKVARYLPYTMNVLGVVFDTN